MSYKVTIDREAGLIRVEGIEQFTDADSAAVIGEIKSQPEYRRYPMVFDFTGVRRLDLSESHLEYLGFKIRTEIPLLFRALIVNDRDRDLADMFTAYAGGRTSSIDVFADREQAEAWLLSSCSRLDDVMAQVQQSLEEPPLRIPASGLA